MQVKKVANRFEDKVASVSKALTILEELSKEPNGMGLIDISSQVGMNKTTVYRMLTSLMEKEFVEQDDASGKYSLGLKILSIASALYEKLDIRAIVRKYVSELLENFQGTILVTKELDQEYMIVDRICMGQAHRPALHEGEILSEGQIIQKTFLANAALWQQGRNMLYANSFREDAALRHEMKQIALQGYAESSEDLDGLPAIAAPVFNFSKNVVYVVSLHSQRLSDRKVQAEWMLRLMELVKRISGDLGFVNYI